MLARWIVLVVVVGTNAARCAQAQQNADRGAVLGGVAGGLLGAGIGKHNDETAAGALIGGAVGVVTGAMVGNSMDQRANEAYVRQQYYQQARRQQVARAISSYDVISMSQSGVSPDVIINQIRQNGVQQAPNVQDVILMHRQGVHDAVIAAMQEYAAGPALPAPAPAIVERPVVVEQYHYVAPPPPYWGPYHHHPRYGYRHSHHYHRPSPGVSWGISVRN